VRYGVTHLFDLNSGRIEICLERLRRQVWLYWFGSRQKKRQMQIRALYMTALTLNATAIGTAIALGRGRLVMKTSRLFFLARWKKAPENWGRSAKGCFARALSGFGIRKDGVCIDRHLERLGVVLRDAPSQWLAWFRVYEQFYGQGETAACIRWHVEVLDWIAGLGNRPGPWK
jgi:hypothetical protein